MQCYSCGENIPAKAQRCPACGGPRSKRIYIPLCGILGGLIGSFVGYNAWDVPGALLVGLFGIAGFELLAWAILRPNTDGSSQR